MIIKFVLLALAILAAGCIRDRNQREWEYMPDMYRSAAIKAQEAAPVRTAEDTLGKSGVSQAFPRVKETPQQSPDTMRGGTVEDTGKAKSGVASAERDITQKGSSRSDTLGRDTAQDSAAKVDNAKGDTSKAVSAAAVSPQPAYPRGNSLMRQPPEGTVPRDREVYWPEISDSTASFGMVNPLPVTIEVLETGKKYFNIYCAVCHGLRGAGDGPVIPKMPPPPALSSDKVCQWPDGRIHHVIVHGQGNMPSYRRTVDVTTRWAIIRYLRVIQRAENPTAADLQEYKKVSQRHF